MSKTAPLTGAVFFDFLSWCDRKSLIVTRPHRDSQRDQGGAGRPHHIELINGAFLEAGGSPDEYRAGLDRAITNVRNLREVHAGRRGDICVGRSCLRLEVLLDLPQCAARQHRRW